MLEQGVGSAGAAKGLRIRPFCQMLAAWLIVIGVFTIPLLGTAAHNLFLGLALILGLLSFPLGSWTRTLRTYPAISMGLALFVWLGLSAFWGSVPLGDGIAYWGKYRELLIIPVFAMLFIQRPDLRDKAAISLYIALFLSLIAAYLIHNGLVDWTENAHSLKNRIFHGISMSLFGYWTLRVVLSAKELQREIYRYVALGAYGLAAYSIFFIENGRTGYLCFLGLSGLAVLERLGLRKSLKLIAIAVPLLAALFALLGVDHVRILTGHNNLVLPETASLSEQLQVADIRLEYWIVGALTYLEHWLLGAGVGSFELAYQNVHSSMATYWAATANAHNEMLMIGIQSGIIGLLLYLGFIVLTARFRASVTGTENGTLWMHSGLAMAGLIFVAGLFNSSIMDHGDGILFASALSLMFAGARMPAFLFADDAKPPTVDN